MPSALAEKMALDDKAYTGSIESIAVVEELERRRVLVEEGDSKLISEEESWAFLKSSGCHV